ncbi:poly(ADP-ribose) glycohydrolase-like [Lineus longissimus]|uniref:poly(ADP-ribose) glycohydrolase-like n=1 Tax=Lineus longissimus TaxID=88925 RepID=UPI002B4E5F02
MSEPPKKKLKQSSLLASFNVHKKIDVKEESEYVVNLDSDSCEDPSTMDKEDTEKRDVLAKAAEKRAKMETYSPVTTPKKTLKSTTNDSPSHGTRSATAAAAALPVPGLSKSDSVQSECSATLAYDAESPLLFTDSETTDQEDSQNSLGSWQQCATQSSTSGEDLQGTGFPYTEMNVTPSCSMALPPLQPSASHIVLFRPHLQAGRPPRPYPDAYRDSWDADHVRMPCSNENIYPVLKDGKKELKNRWDLIRTALLDNITSSYDVEEAIIAYNSRYENKWDFSGLHTFFTELLEAEESNFFFKQVFPKMVELALRLPNICTQPLPLLKKQSAKSVSLSKEQVSCLLANAFFCTFPRRNTRQKQSEYSTFPDINFNRLYQGQKSGYCRRKVEKLKCIFNYFKRVLPTAPEGIVTFTRKVLRDAPKWSASVRKLTRLYVSAHGTIEGNGTGMLQADFANKYIGGGALGRGLVQEEVRFVVCPEMLLTRLFTEELDDNECLVMTGCEQFSRYEGYADSFKWTGNYKDPSESDSWGRKYVDVVAMDALPFRTYGDQFKLSNLKRELNKAYCAFHEPDVPMKNRSAVATGKWGCGAFGGDAMLKALIQIMAAAESSRDICYFTFGDPVHMDEIYDIHTFLVAKDCTVGDCWALIIQYANLIAKLKKPKKNLFEYIKESYLEVTSDTDGDSPKPDSDDNFAQNTP